MFKYKTYMLSSIVEHLRYDNLKTYKFVLKHVAEILAYVKK